MAVGAKDTATDRLPDPILVTIASRSRLLREPFVRLQRTAGNLEESDIAVKITESPAQLDCIVAIRLSSQGCSVSGVSLCSRASEEGASARRRFASEHPTYLIC